MAAQDRMKRGPHIKTQFLLDNKWKKTGVFLTITDYEKILDTIENLSLIALAESIKQKNEPTITLEKLKQKLAKKQSR